MEILIIFIAVLILILLSILNAFHILSLSQKNIKNARVKLIDSIYYYFDLVPRQLNQVAKLHDTLATQFFLRKAKLVNPNLSELIVIYTQQALEFTTPDLQKQKHVIAENIHLYNQFIIKMEHKLAKSSYEFLSKLLKIVPPKHISE